MWAVVAGRGCQQMRLRREKKVYGTEKKSSVVFVLWLKKLSVLNPADSDIVVQCSIRGALFQQNSINLTSDKWQADLQDSRFWF